MCCASAPRARTRRSAITIPTTGELAGYDVDVRTAVGEKLGVNVEFVETPWDSIFAALEANRFDVVANEVTINPERKAKYDLSEPYSVGEGVIVTRADDDSITSLADLKGKLTAQSTTSNWAQVARDAGARVEAVEGFAQAITLLNQGRVDAVVNDSIAVYAYLAENRATQTSRSPRSTGEKSEQGFAARKNSGLLPDLNTALDELKSRRHAGQRSRRQVPQGERHRCPRPRVSGPPKNSLDVAADRRKTCGRWPKPRSPDDPADHHQLRDRPGDRARGGAGPAVARMWSCRTSPGSTSRSSAAPRCWCSCSSSSTHCRSSGIKLDPFPAAVIAFSLNVGGYAAEIIRSAIQSIPKGQWEAAETIGLNYAGALRRIVLPQAARVAVPPLSNTLISLVKDTSLASTILVTELLRQAQIIAAPKFEFFALYGTAAVYYWVICLALSFGQDRLEHRLERYVAR